MPLDLTPLDGAPRLLIEAELKPLQGTRFQPTGFPNLGPARYRGPDGTEMLLVESAQSMANRLETLCWDGAVNDWIMPLRHLPLAHVLDAKQQPLTNSVLESHRLNSAYVLDADGKDGTKNKFVSIIQESLKKIAPNGPIVMPELARFVLAYCPNTLLHGVFFANRAHNDRIGAGRLRLPRILSAFIEATDVRVASSGGAKIDRQDASGKNDGGSSETGYGNVPYPRDEFTARRVTAYFNVDLAQIRGYRLGDEAEKFLIAFSLLKIRRFLSGPMRLRTACDFELDCEEMKSMAANGEVQKLNKLKVMMPDQYPLPELEDIEKAVPGLIGKVADKGSFIDPPLTVVWREPSSLNNSSGQA